MWLVGGAAGDPLIPAGSLLPYQGTENGVGCLATARRAERLRDARLTFAPLGGSLVEQTSRLTADMPNEGRTPSSIGQYDLSAMLNTSSTHPTCCSHRIKFP